MLNRAARWLFPSSPKRAPNDWGNPNEIDYGHTAGGIVGAFVAVAVVVSFAVVLLNVL